MKKKYDAGRLKVKGYKAPGEGVEDRTEMAYITEFERKLPFGLIDIDEFERRVKKLSDPE